MSRVRLLVVGTGNMARAHAAAFAEMPEVDLVSAIDTDPERLASFCDEFGIEGRHASIDAAIAAGGFEAVTNVTPDAVHHRTTMPFLAAGKHVLCEKPLATSEADAVQMAEAAAAAGVVNMVNLTYRNVAALNTAQRIVASGDIGEVRHFDAAYLQSWLTQPAWGDWKTDQTWLWRLSTAHGSAGVLGDVGVHIVDFLLHATGQTVEELSCRLTTFDKAPGGQIGEYVLDANDSMTMQARLSGGASGVVHASRMATGHVNDLILRIHGTKGALEVTFAQSEGQLRGCIGDAAMQVGEWSDIEAPEVKTNYRRFIDAILAGTDVQPDFAHGAMLQRVLDLGVVSDAAGGLVQTV